jgi:hypothetical protein
MGMSTDSTVGALPLPKRLLSLIESGVWPRTNDGAQRQSLLSSRVLPERIHLFAPEEDAIYLYRPPFTTIAARASKDKAKFWARWGALEEISSELSVDIGDFGLGSDSPIVLDYRRGHTNPAVIRLKWRKPEPNTWVRCATLQTCSGWIKASRVPSCRNQAITLIDRGWAQARKPFQANVKRRC